MWYTVALLACPVSMGLMMIMMMRGQHSSPPDQRSSAGVVDEVAALRAQVQALTAQHTPDEPTTPAPR